MDGGSYSRAPLLASMLAVLFSMDLRPFLSQSERSLAGAIHKYPLL